MALSTIPQCLLKSAVEYALMKESNDMVSKVAFPDEENEGT